MSRVGQKHPPPLPLDTPGCDCDDEKGYVDTARWMGFAGDEETESRLIVLGRGTRETSVSW